LFVFRSLINHENRDYEQIFGFYSMFYSNFIYMIQTLTTVNGKTNSFHCVSIVFYSGWE